MSAIWFLALLLLLRAIISGRSIVVCGRGFIIVKGWCEVSSRCLCFSFLSETESNGVDDVLFAICFCCCSVDIVHRRSCCGVHVLAFAIEVVVRQLRNFLRRAVFYVGGEGVANLRRQVSKDDLFLDIVESKIFSLLDDLRKELRWTASVSADAIEQGLGLLALIKSVFFPKVSQELRPRRFRWRAEEEGVKFGI